MIQLTDAEISTAREKVIELGLQGLGADKELYLVSFGARAQFKKMVEWLEDNASLEEYKDGRKWRRDGMLVEWDDWQTLLGEVK